MEDEGIQGIRKAEIANSEDASGGLHCCLVVWLLLVIHIPMLYPHDIPLHNLSVHIHLDVVEGLFTKYVQSKVDPAGKSMVIQV